jgi:hypothetical protein
MDPRGYPAPPPPPRSNRGGFVVAGLVGLVVGGLLVGGAWMLFGGGDGTSSTPIAAPERIGDYSRFGDAAERKDEERGGKVADRYRDWDKRSSERLSAAHEGAGAFVQSYTNDDLEETFVLEAVRAPSPFPPYAQYSDPEVLGMERPVEELREFGDVGCLVRNDPSTSYVLSCVRTDDELTVRITHAAGDLIEDPEAVAKLVDTAWGELS